MNPFRKIAADSREAKTCPPKPFGCAQPINMDDFKDDLSRKEYQISGLCQKCQDSVFGDTGPTAILVKVEP